MLLKFQHSSTSCLRISSSTETNVGISVTPPPHNSSYAIKKYGFFEGRIERNLDFMGGVFNGRINGATVGDSSDGKVKKDRSFEIRVNGVAEGLRDRNPVAKIRACKKERGTQPNCSKKCGRYGGRIPAMLEALEKIRDVEEALKPWETTLTNQERSSCTGDFRVVQAERML